MFKKQPKFVHFRNNNTGNTVLSRGQVAFKMIIIIIIIINIFNVA